MEKIVTIDQAVDIANDVRKKGKRIVLAGGCFDILHVGHITFLEKARAAGDKLFIMLEGDAAIKKLKGENRPINSQADRARILSAIESVDVVVALGDDLKDADYDNLIMKIQPDVIATSEGDTYIGHKERQAKMVLGKVVEVTGIISDQSTSRLVKILGAEL